MDPKLKSVEGALTALHIYISAAFEQKWPQVKVAAVRRQYLYALLYESVRWMTHQAGPVQFLQRLFCGSLICEALNELNEGLKRDVN